MIRSVFTVLVSSILSFSTLRFWHRQPQAVKIRLRRRVRYWIGSCKVWVLDALPLVLFLVVLGVIIATLDHFGLWAGRVYQP